VGLLALASTERYALAAEKLLINWRHGCRCRSSKSACGTTLKTGAVQKLSPEKVITRRSADVAEDRAFGRASMPGNSTRATWVRPFAPAEVWAKGSCPTWRCNFLERGTLRMSAPGPHIGTARDRRALAALLDAWATRDACATVLLRSGVSPDTAGSGDREPW